MTIGDRAGLGGPLDLLQQVNLGEIAEGGGLYGPESLNFNPGFCDCFRYYRFPHVAPEALRDSLKNC